MSELEEFFEATRQAHFSGDLTTAAKGYAQILTTDPTHADAWHLVGLLSHQSGHSDDGLQQIEMAIRLNPTNAEYFSNLAAILNRLERSTDALVAANQALSIDPTFGPASLQKGIACSAMDQKEEALQSLQQSLDSEFADATVLQQRAEAKQRLGDIQGALDDLNQSLELEPNNASAYFQLASFVRAKQGVYSESQVDCMRGILANPDLDLTTTNRLNLAMAVNSESVSNFDAAFDFFKESNRAAMAQVSSTDSFSSKRESAKLTRVLEAFTRSSLENYADVGNPSKRPIFVVGMPRSGTTLVQQILASHSAVAGAGELTILDDLFWQRVCQSSPQDPTADLLPAGQAWIAELATHYLNATDSFANANSDSNALPADSITHVVDKMPTNYWHVGFIRLLFPQAAIISCVRDPRDICLSCFCQSFESTRHQLETGSLDHLTIVFQNYARLMEHWNSLFPGSIHEVFYENLVESPEATIRSLLGSLELNWDDRCLEFDRSQTQVRTASQIQVRRPFYRSSNAKWKRYERHLAKLSQTLQSEIERFEENCAQAVADQV
ncbi:MAG: tetratricopeptide (TPR) repeat protein [Mariniblastus sp.]|jgi:tetratricopeptide (TPR) repeat protein